MVRARQSMMAHYLHSQELPAVQRTVERARLYMQLVGNFDIENSYQMIAAELGIDLIDAQMLLQ
jgi:hypothetical protein